MKQHYTKKDYEALLQNVKIVCQTNEQKNEHILSWFDDNGIGYVNRAIPEGDYSLMVKACPELGFPMDTYFFDEIFIERKNSLQELASSLYGQKETPAYANAVIVELKKSSIVTPTLTNKLIKDIKSEYAVYDDAFNRELKRAINKPYKFLIVEQQSGYDGILNHDYPNNYSESSYFGTVISIMVKYGITPIFCPKERTGQIINQICRTILNQYIDR